jgi:hypothetical protein
MNHAVWQDIRAYISQDPHDLKVIANDARIADLLLLPAQRRVSFDPGAEPNGALNKSAYSGKGLQCVISMILQAVGVPRDNICKRCFSDASLQRYNERACYVLPGGASALLRARLREQCACCWWRGNNTKCQD